MNGDKEKQVIFYGPSAKTIIYIRKGTSKRQNDALVWQVCDAKKKKILYEDTDMEKVIDWAVNNYEQYKNRMVSYNKHNTYGKTLNNG